jgi:hypothetical protein
MSSKLLPRVAFKHSSLNSVKSSHFGQLRRTVITEAIPAIAVPPIVFSGLLLSLWSWKCAMMVLFQNKIIYMPGIPIGARHERIGDYVNQCSQIDWVEERTHTEDGVEIALCVAEDPNSNHDAAHTVVVYFQGLV